MAQQFVLQHRTGPRTFTVRDVRNAASTALYIEYRDDIIKFIDLARRAAETPGDRDTEYAAAEVIRIFFPTEERTDRTMQMILAGDHSGVEWFFDADIQLLVDALMAWGQAMAARHGETLTAGSKTPAPVTPPAVLKKPARAKKPIRKR